MCLGQEANQDSGERGATEIALRSPSIDTPRSARLQRASLTTQRGDRHSEMLLTLAIGLFAM